MVGISDISVGQSAHQLAAGRLWIEGMDTTAAVAVPICTMGEVIQRVGPHDLDLTGAQIKSDGLPQGPFEKLPGLPKGAAYPCLWNHDNVRERKLIVEADSHCQVRAVNGQVPEALAQRAAARWATASKVHYNRDLRFTSQSLIVAMTPQPSIGGRAWPTIVFDELTYEPAYALWCNSTLGLLCHWWMANKTQEGRGTNTVTGLPLIPTLDVRKLTQAQHDAAADAFQRLSELRFLPFDQIDEDMARAELDRTLIVDILGLDATLCAQNGPVDRLRRKLAAEPQIHANKRTRLVFTDSGETSLRRPERQGVDP